MDKKELMTDEEAVNYIASFEQLAVFGKYDTLKLASSLRMDEFDVQSLGRTGLVNSEYMITPNGGNGKVTIFYEFNDRWRHLKRFGNYADFILWEKDEAEREVKKKQHERDFIKAQLDNVKFQNELTPLLKSANKSTVVTNKILITVFTLTLAVYIGQLVVSYRTYQLTNNTTQKQLKIEQLEPQLQQNKAATAKPKVDSLRILK